MILVTNKCILTSPVFTDQLKWRRQTFNGVTSYRKYLQCSLLVYCLDLYLLTDDTGFASQFHWTVNPFTRQRQRKIWKYGGKLFIECCMIEQVWSVLLPKSGPGEGHEADLIIRVEASPQLKTTSYGPWNVLNEQGGFISHHTYGSLKGIPHVVIWRR